MHAMLSQICLGYHPTTVVFVDDNKNFLKTLQFEFKNKLIGKFYHEPVKALQLLSNEYQANSFTQRGFIEPTDEQSDHLFSQVNLRQIHKQSEVKNRFAEVAVCVIDYTMPSMTGLELSKHIKAIHPNIHIILLTGEADHGLAVEAFNEGIIDKFIKKSSSELITTLYMAIQELTNKYFMSLSQSIIITMNGAADKFKRLRDPALISFFNKLCKDKHITEYYLISDSGSFLLIDGQGKPYWLGLVDNSELEGFYYTAVIEKAPEFVVKALKEKVKMPFFFTEDELWTHPSNWEDYLHTAHRLDGLSTYYYTLIEKPRSAEWQPTHIVSYTKYLTDSFNQH